jgi:hypothetical protein
MSKFKWSVVKGSAQRIERDTQTDGSLYEVKLTAESVAQIVRVMLGPDSRALIQTASWTLPQPWKIMSAAGSARPGIPVQTCC